MVKIFFIKGFTLFTDEEFWNGYTKTCIPSNSGEKILLIKEARNFLHYSFGFAPLEEEIKRIFQ